MSGLTLLSHILGWSYTAAWSVSFYGQFLLNWRRKSVSGLSIDFTYLNPLGFACITVFNSALVGSPLIRDQYRSRHHGHLPSVRWNDVVFAVHALVISSLTLLQSLVYPREHGQELSVFNTYFLSFTFSSVTVATVLTGLQVDGLEWLDLLYFFSYIKLYISFAKYLPQVYLNYKRKSTVGWSIANIILDFTGGSLSLAQLVLDAYISQDWQSITGNPAKLGLSFLSIAFDVVFLIQHFVLYPHASPSISGEDAEGEGGAGGRETRPPNERDPLLSSSPSPTEP